MIKDLKEQHQDLATIHDSTPGRVCRCVIALPNWQGGWDYLANVQVEVAGTACKVCGGSGVVPEGVPDVRPE